MTVPITRHVEKYFENYDTILNLRTIICYMKHTYNVAIYITYSHNASREECKVAGTVDTD